MRRPVNSTITPRCSANSAHKPPQHSPPARWGLPPTWGRSRRRNCWRSRTTDTNSCPGGHRYADNSPHNTAPQMGCRPRRPVTRPLLCGVARVSQRAPAAGASHSASSGEDETQVWGERPPTREPASRPTVQSEGRIDHVGIIALVGRLDTPRPRTVARGFRLRPLGRYWGEDL